MPLGPPPPPPSTPLRPGPLPPTSLGRPSQRLAKRAKGGGEKREEEGEEGMGFGLREGSSNYNEGWGGPSKHQLGQDPHLGAPNRSKVYQARKKDQKNPRAHKNKFGTPPPQKKTRNFMDIAFPAEQTHFSRRP